MSTPWERPIVPWPEGVQLASDREVLLEIGPGRGDFLFHLAEAYPQAQVVGVEIKKKRFDKLIPRIEKRVLSNIMLLAGDAREVLPQIFPDNCVSQCYILFSDPWPKKRHAKHRLFQAPWPPCSRQGRPFARELARILKPGGRLLIAHDDPLYCRQIQEEFTQVPSFTFHPQGVDFSTFYAEKWVKEGRRIQSFSYEKL